MSVFVGAGGGGGGGGGGGEEALDEELEEEVEVGAVDDACVCVWVYGCMGVWV